MYTYNLYMFFVTTYTVKKLPQLPVSLMPLGIIGAQFRARMKPLVTIMTCDVQGASGWGSLNWAPLIVGRVSRTVVRPIFQ